MFPPFEILHADARRVCVTYGLGFVDRGHRWEENENFIILREP